MRWQNHTTVFSRAVIVSSDVSGRNLWENTKKKEGEEEKAICSAPFIHEAACALFCSRCSSSKVAPQRASPRTEHPGRLCLNVVFCAGRSETRTSLPGNAAGLWNHFPQRLIVCLSHPLIAARHLGSNVVTGRKCHLCFSRF